MLTSHRQNWRIDRQTLSLFKSILFHLIEQISFGAPEVDNFGAAVPVLLLDSALLAVVSVRDPRPPADDAPTLVAAVVTLVTDSDQGAGPHIRVADGALPVTLLTQPPDGHSRLLPAENEVWVMPSHYYLSN